MGSSRSDFPEQLDLIDNKNFTLIAWDPPGYGYSRAQERVYNKTVYADDAHLAAAMMKVRKAFFSKLKFNNFLNLNFEKRKIGYDQYAVLGWSDGGSLSVYYFSLIFKTNL